MHSYYKHGPLARAVLGQQQVQGLNYAYTLQGWLKAINPDPYTGSGFTLQPDSAGNVVANNAYSLLLNYFNGDYKPISNTAGPDNGVSTALGSGYAALYNGNISSMGVNIKKLNSPLLYNYRYDQLNRLTHMDAWKRTSTAWSALTATTDYQENVSYDPDGNILTYHRNRETTGSGNPMDQLQYSYIPGTNQLDHIYDTVPGVSNANDIATQNAGNYKYDSIGELIGDVASNITNISWTVYGKIASITKAPDTVIRYTYDPAGNRISKTVVHGVDSIVTWYVRDAQGNILSVYTSGDPAVNGRSLTQTELDLYGSSRLGIWKRAVMVANLDSTVHSSFPKSGDSLIFTRGSKLFELTNHLGNVLVTISDKRYGVSSDSMVAYYNPEVVSATDYYPFGMMQYARSWTEANVGGYRYGFNGQEKDDEIKGPGNSYTAEFWEYDPRIGRRWNRDPITKIAESPYSALGNSPIILFDPNGADTINITRTTTRKKGPTMKSGLDNVPSRKIPDAVSTTVSVGIKTADGDDVFNLTDVNVTIDENGNEKSTSTTSTLNLNDAQTFYRTGGHNAKGYLDDRYALAANAPTWLLKYYANKSGDIGVRSALAYQRDIPFTSKLNKIANIGFLAIPGEGYSVEKIEGFYLRSASTLSNGVFRKTIQTLAYMGEDGSGSMLKLVTAIENQARSAGAQTLEIHGVDIVNAKILSTSKAAAEKFGYSFEQVADNSIKLTKQLK